MQKLNQGTIPQSGVIPARPVRRGLWGSANRRITFLGKWYIPILLRGKKVTTIIKMYSKGNSGTILLLFITKENCMIRKLRSGEYRIYSRKKNPKTNKRRNLGTFSTLAAAKKHEQEIQYFKRHWKKILNKKIGRKPANLLHLLPLTDLRDS